MTPEEILEKLSTESNIHRNKILNANVTGDEWVRLNTAAVELAEKCTPEELEEFRDFFSELAQLDSF